MTLGEPFLGQKGVFLLNFHSFPVPVFAFGVDCGFGCGLVHGGWFVQPAAVDGFGCFSADFR